MKLNCSFFFFFLFPSFSLFPSSFSIVTLKRDLPPASDALASLHPNPLYYDDGGAMEQVDSYIGTAIGPKLDDGSGKDLEFIPYKTELNC